MVDGFNFAIDSTDPEILGKWFVEVFARTGPFTAATQCLVRAWPSFSQSKTPGKYEADWITDSHFIGDLYQIHSPRELLTALDIQLQRYEQEHLQ